MHNFSEVEVNRFWSNVSKGGQNDCWHWKEVSRAPGGYGCLWMSGKLQRANRVALSLKLNKPVEDLEICSHSCNEPSCVNPNHLDETTQQENMAFASKSGRMFKKLDARSVIHIRNLKRIGIPTRTLARIFSVSKRMIDYVVANEFHKYALPA